MSKRSEAVKRWRHNTKHKIVVGFGGGCACCGYNRCEAALELHHVNPNEKEFGFGDIMAHPKAFNSMLSELNKCVLVCSNCHKEIHAGIRECPHLVPFNLSLINQTEDDAYDTCPACGNKKKTHYKTCSHECAARMRIKVNWDEVNLVDELKTKSASKLADELGVTSAAVYKRMKKVGLK